MRISDWSSDVCSSDLAAGGGEREVAVPGDLAAEAGAQVVVVVFRLVGELATGERRRHQPGHHRPEPERHFVVEAAVGVAEERSGIAEVHPPGVSGKAHATVEVDRAVVDRAGNLVDRSEEHTSELQSLMRISYAVFCLTKK